mmetsp:Transcript_28888/g.62794  ORF Transcript_28888/g.62794 Transcript_28888/m.62794 type:complete len:249 (-) Transcript_28888:187-933(-)
MPGALQRSSSDALPALWQCSLTAAGSSNLKVYLPMQFTANACNGAWRILLHGRCSMEFLGLTQEHKPKRPIFRANLYTLFCRLERCLPMPQNALHTASLAVDRSLLRQALQDALHDGPGCLTVASPHLCVDGLDEDLVSTFDWFCAHAANQLPHGLDVPQTFQNSYKSQCQQVCGRATFQCSFKQEPTLFQVAQLIQRPTDVQPDLCRPRLNLQGLQHVILHLLQTGGTLGSFGQFQVRTSQRTCTDC